MICPFCGKMVNLPLAAHQHDGPRNTVSANCRCPACGKTSFVWILEPGDGRDPSKRTCTQICVHPDPTTTREPIVEPGHLPEPALERAYYSAIRAYNVGLWDACAMSCRKTLEGIAHSLKPNEQGPLFQQLKKVFESPDLLQPLSMVADSLRKGGNIGAHFDLDREPTQEVASIMIDLLDYFLEYTFVLKERAQELEKRLDNLGGPKA